MEKRNISIYQKQFPEISVLMDFLARIAEYAVFQEEKESKSTKIHSQGNFTLIGQRKSKRDVLDKLKTISGGTLSKIYEKDAILQSKGSRDDTSVAL